MTTEIGRGVSVILYRGGRFAISQRISRTGERGMWQFPGGHVEPGETPLFGAMRELREETGLNLTSERFTLIGTAGPLPGYNGEKYMAWRYGVLLREDEEPQCTEPKKATPWEWVAPWALLDRTMLQATKEYALFFALEQTRR